MKNVKSLIKALQKNYYPDFIVDPLSDSVDYAEHQVLVEYERENYYEKNLKVIDLRQTEIITEVSDLYKKALSELFIKLANTDAKNLNSVITFYIEAIKLNLKTLRTDFYIDDKKSRYFTKIVDCTEITTPSKTIIKDDPDDYPIDGRFLKMIEKMYGINHEYEMDEALVNIYYLGFLAKRYKVLSRLPFSLFHISIKLIVDLQRAKELIRIEDEAKQTLVKLKWTGNKTHIGFILGSLASEGYIEAPISPNGEVNYTAFSRLIKQLFDVDVTTDTLRKYLNPIDEKFGENKTNFENKGFHLPNKKIVS